MKYRAVLVVAACVGSASLFACNQAPPAPDVPGFDVVPIDNDTGPDGDVTVGHDVIPGMDGATGDVADAGDASDAGAMDALGDVSTDGGTGVDAGADSNLPDPCATSAIVDLNAAGTVSGSTTTYTGSTVGTPMASAIPGACVLDVGYEVALRYTVATDSHLRVSTANPGTPSTFDTVAWLLTRCEATGTSLGCNDDSAPGDRRSTFTTDTSLGAGSQAYIIVGGVTPPRTGLSETGAFQLTVTEVPEIAIGGTCDPTGATNVCPMDAHCLNDTPPATCIADGSLHGRCRGPLPGCDAGLGCNGDRLSTTTRCVPLVSAGAACDPTMQTNVCPPGLICIDLGSGPSCH